MAGSSRLRVHKRVLREFLGVMGWEDVRKNQCRSPTTDALSNVFCRFDPNLRQSSQPRTTISYVIWGIFLVLMGVVTWFVYLQKAEDQLFHILLREREFWLSIVFILLFNVIIGLYLAKRRAKQ